MFSKTFHFCAVLALLTSCIGKGGVIHKGAPDRSVLEDTTSRDMGHIKKDSSTTFDLKQDPKSDAKDLDIEKDLVGDMKDGSDGMEDMKGSKCPTQKTRVWIIGDSTVEEPYGGETAGWGAYVQDFLIPSAEKTNLAAGGETALTFHKQDNNDWAASDVSVMKNIKAGDFVLIQFGHNDPYPDADYNYMGENLPGDTDPGEAPSFMGTYRTNLEKYIDDTRSKNAVPILVTPVQIKNFNSAGIFYRSHENYPDSMRKLASDKNAFLIDLEQLSYDTFNGLGEDETLKQYGWAELNGDDSDRTHFPTERVRNVTKLLVELIRKSDSDLKCYLKPL